MPNTSYDTDLTDAAWALVEPLLPAAKTGGRPRTTDTRAVLNGIFYLLRSGCQWRLLPHEFPPWRTVYYYFRSWDNAGVWVHLQRALYEQTRVAAGRETCPSVVIMDGRARFRRTQAHQRAQTPHSGGHIGTADSQPGGASEHV